jgi:alkylhydroperoxidase family enzyme
MPMRTPILLSCVLAAAAGVVPGAQSSLPRPGAQKPVPPARARIAPLAEAARGDVHRKLEQMFGGDRFDAGFSTLLHVPAMAEGIMPYTIYLSENSTLSPRHRELLALRAAWLAGNEVVWATHAARARTAAFAPAELRRVAAGPDAAGWETFEKTLLQLADQLYRNSSVSNRTWTALGGTYSEHQLMDAVETVNHFTMLSMLYNSFGVQSNAPPADRLPADVRYRVNVSDPEPPLARARVEPVPGDGIAVGRTLARHPKLNEARARRANFINRVSKLQPRHREMFILRIGWNCRSEYEWAQHVGSVGRAREHGLEPIRIARGADDPGWDAFEKTILRAVDELYRDASISDRTWAGLAERYDTELLMSAVFTASSYRATSMVLNALGVQLEAGNERFPELRN